MGIIQKSNETAAVDIAGFLHVTRFFSLQSQTSPVINGVVKLRTNDGTIQKGKATGYNFVGSPRSQVNANDARLFSSTSAMEVANSRCAEKFRTEVIGRGNLAVSLAQINKSFTNLGSHIEGLSALVHKDLDRLEAQYPGFNPARPWKRGRVTSRSRRTTHRYERAANTAASKYLEAVFGWLPLVDEFHNQAKALTEVKPYKTTVRASGKAFSREEYFSWYDETHWTLEKAQRCHYRATMLIDNPNAFLKSQTGITSYASAAWDIVPWSFVVNMFTNIGHILAQLSPIQGVQFLDTCRTQRVTSIASLETWVAAGTENYKRSVSNASGYSKSIDSQMPPISFRLRTPSPNLGLGAIALSLATQRLTKISRLINTTSPHWT